MVSNSTIVLAFHRVSDEFSPAYPPMPVKVFDKLCRYLKRNFEVIHPNDLFQSTSSKKQRVLITFDDAYTDFLLYAYPILKKYQLPALQHVITYCADTGESFWTQRLNKTIEAFMHEKKGLTIPSLEIQESKLSIKKTEQIALACYKKMLPLKTEEREQLLNQLTQQLDKPIQNTPMLNWEELRKLNKDTNIVLGSHTHTHENLTILNQNELLEELSWSKNLLEEKLRLTHPIFLAYPNGQFNADVKKSVEKLGYYGAFTTENKFYINDNANEIPRYLMYHTSWWKNWMRLNIIRYL